jgi:hypothetical protein
LLRKHQNRIRIKIMTKPDFLFNNKPRQFHSIDPDQQLLELESELRQRNLMFSTEVQWLMKTAAYAGNSSSQWARDKLRLILESERIMDIRTGDVFRPLAPEIKLCCGDLHLLNQADGVAWKIKRDALTRGMLLAGPQGGGKTRLLIWLCRQLSTSENPVPFLILDPKTGLKGWAGYLNAKYIDIEDIRIDMSPPQGLDYQTWLRSLAPQIGEIIGVIYGVELIQDLCSICLELRSRYVSQRGRETQICLKDLYEAISLLSNVSSGRRAGYKDGVSTGLNRILTGSGELFCCRRGSDPAAMFNHNVILGCRSTTDEFALKFLAFYLLYYLYESERFSAPSESLKRVLVFDDASRFLCTRTGFDAASSVSSLTHIYSVLRSSGNGIIAVSQMPHLLDPGIIALSNTVICVAGLHYAQDTRLIAQVMGLSEQQQSAIPGLARQEALGFCAGSAWNKPVHGFTVDVPDQEVNKNG